jgi:hypothetical protein
MILLTSTVDLLRVTTSVAASVDVHASWVDLNGSTVTPGRTNTVITSATTTTVVASPASSTARNVKTLSLRNKHASLATVATVLHTDGTTIATLYEITLAPGGVLHYSDEAGWSYQSEITATAPYMGVVAGLLGNSDPNRTLFEYQRAGNIAATPTNISVSVARCSLIKLPADLVVNRIRWYGVGATTNVFRTAIYRYSDLARLTAELPFTTVINTWGSVDAGGVSLTAGELYFMAVSVNATGTTAGPGCIGTTTAATTGLISAAPTALPGSLNPGAGYVDNFNFQFAVSTGALPNPAATLVAPAAWTGGFPAFFLDSNAAA